MARLPNISPQHHLIKPVAEFIAQRGKKGAVIADVAQAVGSHEKQTGEVLRYLAMKRRIACIRPNGARNYTYLPLSEAGSDYVCALRVTRGAVSKPRNSNPGKIEGAFCLLQIAGKMIEFESMTELRNFIDAWGAQS
jgi:hypothetical protein